MPALFDPVVGSSGSWRIVATRANGQLAGAAYGRDPDGIYRAMALGVLTIASTGISRVVVFGCTSELLTQFGLLPVHARPLDPH